MDIKIEVVGKEEELEFPYVVEYEDGDKLKVFAKKGRDYTGEIIESSKDTDSFIGQFSNAWANYNIVKCYKILEANYKLKEV